jgi:hypothetical protein
MVMSFGRRTSRNSVSDGSIWPPSNLSTVGRGGGEELAQVGEELHGRRGVRLGDGPGEAAGGGAGQIGPRAASR